MTKTKRPLKCDYDILSTFTLVSVGTQNINGGVLQNIKCIMNKQTGLGME